MTAPKRLRNREIKIRLTDDEYADFQLRKPTNLRLAEWVRMVCLEQEIKQSKKMVTADPDLLIAIARVGNNLNQIAKIANTNKNEPMGLAVLCELEQIRISLNITLRHHNIIK